MPRKGSPYGPTHQRRKKEIPAGTLCVHCGQAPATVPDHQPPLVLHQHVEGTKCCETVPSCLPCSRKQGGHLTNYVQQMRNGAAVEVAEPLGIEIGDAVWDKAPWLDRFRNKIPPGATWPRYMTAPSPTAVDSYGEEAIRWLKKEAGITLRWWQQLALTRELEHDRNLDLCFLQVLSTTARQSGKSTKVRSAGLWRLHQAPRFGEPQLILLTGRDLPVVNALQRPARVWARSRGYKTREQNGNERIEHPGDLSEWVIRSLQSLYGYSASLALADECWDIEPAVISDGLEPTMVERVSPQLVLASTAHRLATPLFPLRRAIALDELRAPSTTLITEWSAARNTPIEDRAAWRQASPHWSVTRERLLEARLQRVLAGETLDQDETDPVQSFLSQFLNTWPITTTTATGGEPLLDTGLWESLITTGNEEHGRLWVAVEDDFGRGACVAAIAEIGDGRFEVDGWTVADRDVALAEATAFASQHPFPATLIVGASLTVSGRRRVERAGAAETRFGLPLLRQLASAGRIVHDAAPELGAQLDACRVKQVSGGLAITAGTRSDLVRALAWGVRAAVVRRPAPAIH